MEEIWKDVKGYEGHYQVSNLGQVKRFKTGKILKGAFDQDGYLKVSLYVNGKSKDYFIHRLVCLAFLPNPEDKPQVNHLNGMKTDNRVENLEWATHSENTQHAWRIGLIDRNKFSELHKKENLSEETLRKMSEAKKGKPLSEEHKKKVSEALKGRQFSEETRRKIGEAKKGKPRPDLSEYNRRRRRKANQ